MADMTPRQIVAELDKYIVGQDDAKKAVAIAIRNRWRRQQLSEDMRKDVTPKNIIMIGPTGVGKTEIARRLAQLIGAPFVKVEATKFTEVGYVGRDVESMIRDLTDSAVGMIQQEQRTVVEKEAKNRATERLLDLLLPPPSTASWEESDEDEEEDEESEDEEEEEEIPSEEMQRYQRSREKMRKRLESGEMEERQVELILEQKIVPVQVFSNLGMEQMDVDFQNMFERIMPRQKSTTADDRQGGTQGFAGTGNRGPDRQTSGDRTSHRAGGEQRHCCFWMSSTKSAAATRAHTGLTCPARACSAICCRSSKGRR